MLSSKALTSVCLKSSSDMLREYKEEASGLRETGGEEYEKE